MRFFSLCFVLQCLSLQISEYIFFVQVNKSHILLQNTLSISLTQEKTITRRDLKVVWKCVYPRHYVRITQVIADMEW